MDEAEVRRRLVAFLDGHPLAVVATVHAGRAAPEAAIVGFGHTPTLELVFGTAVETRKYANLRANPRVALVIGWSSEAGSVQYEGLARELQSAELRAYAPRLLAKDAGHAPFLDREDQRYFLVTPTWVRFYDNAADPPATHELAF